MRTLSAVPENAIREMLADWYRRNRERSAQLFALVDPQAYYQRPIALRHPFAFYEGHLPAFSFLVLNERALGEHPIDPALEKTFERGIDPATADAARAHDRQRWPSKDAVEAFARTCDDRVLDAISHATLFNDFVPRLVRGQAIFTVLEHEQMHHETLMYIIHRLPPDQKGRIEQDHHDTTPPSNEFLEVDAGMATLGAKHDAIPFGWDNEFNEHRLLVPSFRVQTYPVTNADYLEFVREGGPVPPFWVQRDDEFTLRCAFEELPMPLSWPVYATHDQAEQYTRWKGCRLMTEPEYHRAAYGAPDADERMHPWGTESPDALHGNFGFERFDPEPVDAHPAGASAWGIYDLVGNGWEWTSSIFGPFPGFEPMASYPQYSADFFDGKHYVMKGASPVTGREMIRRSFRNWFYGDYPYMYAKFRCVK
ncbi:MAG TPA: SUMF1/EgtB/PvdO family nonheme iron enzyme [Candidatus Baltobacteraceae bacterium]|jgi:formylglycine-generating enzyme required for sulfatase activity|nr:SUMF1/EgtB/PvdO family nonheme iron enzyme [Candidatus Baltobacteraceae bacterium]